MLEKLWIRLLLAFATVLGVAVGSAAVYINYATTSEFQDYVSEGAARFNQRVERVVERVYRDQGWPGVVTYVTRQAEVSNLQIVIVDSSGSVLADTDGRVVGSTLPPSSRVRTAPSLPISDPAGAIIGTIYFRTQDQSRVEAFLTEMNRALLLGAGFGVVLAFLLSLLLARRIVVPIERLMSVVQKMQQGNLSQRIDKPSGTEVGKLAEAFNVMADRLERGQTLRRNMVADVAHELRTPLHDILGYLEMLHDGIVQPTPEIVADIHEEASQLKRLVDDLQQLAVVESSQLLLERRPVSIAALLRQTAAIARPRLDEKNVAVAILASPDLPDVEVDEGRISQVLRNLVNNAITFTPRGGRITLSAERVRESESYIEVSVKDTGIGIPSDDLPLIFERFYRADKSRSRSTGGAGLGLTIVRQLVEAHGGNISVESKAGAGACFRFTLPLLQHH